MIDPVWNLDGTAPQYSAPAGCTDTHMHIFEPGHATDANSPAPPPVASLAEYRKLQARLGIERVVVVQPNAYQKDNACLEWALAELGDAGRGVAVVDAEVSEAELERLHGLGVRGARIMDFGNGAVGTDRMLAVAERIQPLGWHCIVQFNGRQMEEKLPILKEAPGTFVIDHAGKFIDPVAPKDPLFQALLALIDRGNCYVKISACYETSLTGAPDYEDVGILSRALADHASERTLWASNWPHVSATPESYPDDARLLDLFFDWVPKEEDRRKILVENPAGLYDYPA